MAFEHDYKNFPELTNVQLQELQFTSPHVQITEDFTAIVEKVHDGDTVTLSVNFRDFTFPLRLLNINAPELNEGGEVAREWLKQKLEKKKILVQINPSNRVGKYGRLLGIIYYNGLDVGEEMQHLGLVSEFGKKDEGKVPDINKIMKEAQIG